MHHWGKMVCEKLKFKVNLYFVTCVHRSINKIIKHPWWHAYNNKQGHMPV